MFKGKKMSVVELIIVTALSILVVFGVLAGNIYIMFFNVS